MLHTESLYSNSFSIFTHVDIFYSLIFPIHNEEARIHNICAIIDFFKANLLENFEIILVSNGSTDATNTLANELALKFPQVKLIETSKVGRGNALRLGFLAARGKLVGVCAIDRAWDEHFFLEAAEIFRTSNIDIVYGPKTHPHSKISRPFIRRVISYFSKLYIAFLFNMPLEDTQCIKLFKKESCSFIENLGDYNYFAEVEFYLYAKSAHLKAVSIPVLVCDSNLHSKVRLISLWQFLLEAMHFRFKN